MSEAELTPCLEGSIGEVKRLKDLCEQEGIFSSVGAEACAKPGCTPKAQLLVQPEDVQKVGALLRKKWEASLEAEGFTPVQLQAGAEDGEPPCPACGTAAPLKDGACSDCGLQLE